MAPTTAVTKRTADARPHVAMGLYSDVTHDGRVQREAASLARAGYQVTIYGLSLEDAPAVTRVPGVEIVSMRPATSGVLPGTQSPFRQGEPGMLAPAAGGRIGWIAGYAANMREWGRWVVRTAGEPAVWHAHDLPGLLGLALGGLDRGAKVVYDSHELYLESGSAARMPMPARYVLQRIERRLARRAAGVVTVNTSIARELTRRYGIDPVVVMNCPWFAEVERPGRMRAALGLGDRDVILYHGEVGSSRGIEPAIEALQYLPESVVFVVLGNGSLVPWVRAQMERPELSGRLFWHRAVPQRDLLEWVVDATVGAILIVPTELNYVLSSPNKLFECLTAGVPVVATDLPEIAGVVLGEGVGVLCDPADPRLVADAIRGMLAKPEEMAAMRRRAIAAARTAYNWEAQAAGLVELYDRVLAAT